MTSVSPQPVSNGRFCSVWPGLIRSPSELCYVGSIGRLYEMKAYPVSVTCLDLVGNSQIRRHGGSNVGEPGSDIVAVLIVLEHGKEREANRIRCHGVFSTEAQTSQNSVEERAGAQPSQPPLRILPRMRASLTRPSSCPRL
jgi:hypothetical protein